jgi:hypothetical protein
LGFRHRHQTVAPILELVASELLHQLGVWQGGPELRDGDFRSAFTSPKTKKRLMARSSRD